jgi:signal transduction histidine kinase
MRPAREAGPRTPLGDLAFPDPDLLPSGLPSFLARWITYETILWLAIALAVAILAWALAILTLHRIGFALVAPRGQAGVEAAGALARLFAALVLFLFPSRRGTSGLAWIAAGLVVLGLGSLIFGYLGELVVTAPSVNTSAYEFLTVRTLSAALFAIGLLPRKPPAFTFRRALLIALCFLVCVDLLMLSGLFPVLVHVHDLTAAARSGEDPLNGLTAWHWGLSMIPLFLAVAAAVGAARRPKVEMYGGWLLIAMVFLAGSQLHNLFWPSVYSPVLSTADVLRFAFAAVVTLWAILELRGVALQRTALLEAEREQSRRLTELNELRSSFSSMVAHELAHPLAAVRFATEILESAQLARSEETEMLATIRAQVAALTALVADVQAAARMEQTDFSVNPQPVLLASILSAAALYAETLPGGHPVSHPYAGDVMVMADERRVVQVLRNLLSNAAKYSPDGTPIDLHIRFAGSYVYIEVEDHGYGISPEDMTRVFEKFGRGRTPSGLRVPGMGLGLYLSRRIVQAHGSELTVRSVPGEGSVLGFTLAVVQ